MCVRALQIMCCLFYSTNKKPQKKRKMNNNLKYQFVNLILFFMTRVISPKIKVVLPIATAYIAGRTVNT